MPIYEYECEGCGERFELRRSMNDSDSQIVCPKCGKRAPKRLLSLFSSGSGGNDCSSGGSSGST